jgi:hypothetical protein
MRTGVRRAPVLPGLPNVPAHFKGVGRLYQDLLSKTAQPPALPPAAALPAAGSLRKSGGPFHLRTGAGGGGRFGNGPGVG